MQIRYFCGCFSPVYFDNSYVIAKITKENLEGLISMDEVENNIRQEIRNERKWCS